MKELQEFFGLSNYYRRFIKNYAALTKPLYEILKNKEMIWNNDRITAFNGLKQALISSQVLRLPSFWK